MDISKEKVLELSQQPPKLSDYSVDTLIASVEALLSDANVTTSGLVACSIKDTKPFAWDSWINWFHSTENSMMENLIKKASQKLATFA